MAGHKKGSELERLVEAWLQLQGWKTHRAAASGLVKLPGRKPFVKSHDLFGCFDFLAHKLLGTAVTSDTLEPMRETWALQVTTPTNRSHRRDKVAVAAPFPITWLVSVLYHQSVRVGRATEHCFMVEHLLADGTWTSPEKHPVDVTALEAHRRAKAKRKSRLARR